MAHQFKRQIVRLVAGEELLQPKPEEQSVRSDLTPNVKEKINSAFDQRAALRGLPPLFDHPAHNERQSDCRTPRQARQAMHHHGLTRMALHEPEDSHNVLSSWGA